MNRVLGSGQPRLVRVCLGGDGKLCRECPVGPGLELGDHALAVHGHGAFVVFHGDPRSPGEGILPVPALDMNRAGDVDREGPGDFGGLLVGCDGLPVRCVVGRGAGQNQARGQGENRGEEEREEPSDVGARSRAGTRDSDVHHGLWNFFGHWKEGRRRLWAPADGVAQASSARMSSTMPFSSKGPPVEVQRDPSTVMMWWFL